MDFTARAESAYANEPHPIFPHIGDGFEQPRPSDLRLALVGLNAYYSERHWPPDPVTAPPDWARRFREPRGRFFTSARNLAAQVAEAVAPSPHFSGRSLREPESIYATNAVKSWVRDGRRASSVDAGMLERGEAVWRRELTLMAEHDALPHVIVVLTKRFWRRACSSLRNPPDGLAVLEHTSTGAAGYPDAPCRHFVNRYVIRGSGEPQPLLLVRLFHPSAPKRRDASGLPRGTVRWLCAQPDFRAVAGLP